MALSDDRVPGGGVGRRVTLGGTTDSSGNPAGNVVVSGANVPGTVQIATENRYHTAPASVRVHNDTTLGGIAGVMIQVNGLYSTVQAACSGVPPKFAGMEFLPINDSIIVYPEPGEVITNIFTVAVGQSGQHSATTAVINAGNAATGNVDAVYSDWEFTTDQAVNAAVIKLSGYTIDNTATQAFAGNQRAILHVSGRSA